MNSEEQDVFGELSYLVETLTTSGSQSLDQDLFKRVKSICKSSDENVRHLHRIMMTQLEKEHAEIRLSSLQIIKEIFSRSHVFRELLTDDFQHFLELTIGTNADLPLPEPGHIAVILKTQSLQAIEKWHEKYGLYYKKLALGYTYLKRVKKFEFDGVRSRSVLERQRAEDTETRRTNLTQQKLNIVLSQMEETVPEINNIVTAMGNCFHLVLPRPEEFDVYDEAMSGVCQDPEQTASQVATHDVSQATSGDPTNDNALNHHGVSSQSYQLNITLGGTSVEIVETEDNKDIFNTLREQHKQITIKYLPLVQKWLDVLTRHSGNSEKLVQAIDLRNSINELKQKFEKLVIISEKNPINTTRESLLDNKDENEEEDEPEEKTFVDVPEKEEVEHIPEFKRHEYGLKPLKPSSSNSSKTCKDQSAHQVSCVSNTFHWNANGCPEDPTELGDPCSRATALSALKQKQKEKSSSDPTITRNQNSPNCVQTEERKEERWKAERYAGDEKQAELLKTAPVIPFDMDLYNWGRPRDDEAPSSSNLKSLHCFWAHGNDENDGHCPGDIRESLQSRSIKFTGEFQEVKWACRAPLASGKLCPRRDRYRCPFHGKIIPRDEMGEPADSDGNESLTSTNNIEEEAEITRDVELATGLNLGSQKTKGKKRKHPGLTDLKKKTDTSRSRLEKIVFDKSSLQRVSSEMDKVRKSLIDEKFGNKFNYALSK